MKWPAHLWDQWQQKRAKERIDKVLLGSDERVRQHLDRIIGERLESVTSAPPTVVTPESVRSSLAEIARTKQPHRLLVVHPDQPDLAAIKQAAADMNLDVVLGNPALIKRGEAYVMRDPEHFIKKETWQ